MAMTQEHESLKAMRGDPADTALRLSFANFLAMRGDPRGELLRLTHSLTQSIAIPNRPELEERLHILIKEGVQPIGPFLTNGMGMAFSWIPPGSFLGLCSRFEKGTSKLQRMRYGAPIEIRLTTGYFMGIRQVTQEEWQTVMGSNPSYSERRHDLPVEWVSWHACQEFTHKLRERDDRNYRLATEAEWEYACRAGTTTAFHFGNRIPGEEAAYDAGTLTSERPTPAQSLPANAFGLKDMHGNISDWCQDWFGDYPQVGSIDPQGPSAGNAYLRMRVYRGGWYDAACERAATKACPYGSALRCGAGPGGRGSNIGLRLCFSLDK
jgi:uncharacterized protein (TIGR02996 family)